MPEHCIATILSEHPELTVVHKGSTSRSNYLIDVTLDSRHASEHHIFVALAGERFDGRDFIQATKSTTIIVENWESELLNIIRSEQWILQTTNVRQLLAELAVKFNSNPSKSLQMIGITGTNGKTTTTWMLSHILNSTLPDQLVGTIGTIGQRINGVPIPLQNGFTTPESPQMQKCLRHFVDSGCSICIMEVSSIGLMMQRVGGIEFDVAAFTNFTQDHLDIHGSMNQYLSEKQKLFTKHINESSTSVLVTDHDSIKSTSVSKGIRQTISTKENSTCSWWVQNPQFSVEKSTFLCHHENNQTLVELPCIGEHNIENAMVSIAIAHALGVPIKSAAASLSKLPQTPGRLQRIIGAHLGYAFVDYAHTPDALEQSMQSLRKLCQGRLWVVFGCGGDRDKGKRPLMGDIAANLADCIVLTSDNPRSEHPSTIIQDIADGIPKERLKQVTQIVDRKEAIHWCLSNIQSQDILLVAGKGHETVQIIGSNAIDFDDRQVISEWIAK